MGRLFRYFAFALMLTAGLCGCERQAGIEDRAYALVLAMDAEADGALTLTACVPRVGKSSGREGSESSEPSPYMFFSATGNGYAQALTALQLAVPRPLNLSHIVLLAVSEDLAEDARFPAIVNQASETRNLYTAARMVVCPDRAAEFIRGEDTLIGSRLSSEIEGAMDHYAGLGAIPDARLADLYCAANAIYGDLAVPFAAKQRDADAEAEADPREILLAPGAEFVRDTPAKILYSGSSVFSGGQSRLRLGPRDSLCLGLLAGSARRVRAQLDGKPVTLTLHGRAARSADLRGGVMRLGIRLTLSTQEPLSAADRAALEGAMAEAVTHCVHACQSRALDPFGFAERAARYFLTAAGWQRFHWREKYAAAPLEVRVRVRSG